MRIFPRPALATASRRGRRHARRRRQDPYLDCRSARRHHQFPARHSAIRGRDRAPARRHGDRRRDLQSRQDELYTAERGKGAFLNDQRLRVAGRRKLDECVIACGLPHIGRGDHDLSRAEMTEIQNRVAGLRRFGAASLDMAFVAAGRLDGYWERNLHPGTWRPGKSSCAKPAVSSPASPATTIRSSPEVICGNEHVHAELVKILRPL